MTSDSASSSMTSGMRALTGAEVLIIDKDERVRKGMTQLLSAAHLHVTAVDDPSEAWEHLDKQFFSVIVCDLDTPQPNEGLETASTAHMLSPTSMVVMITPRKSFDDTVAAIRAGAMDVILKSPESVQYLKERILQAAGRSVDRREMDSILKEVKSTHDEFLKKLMELDRRTLDVQDELAGRQNSIASLKEAVRVLVVCGNDGLAAELTKLAPKGFEFEAALSGGQALDTCSSAVYHIAMVGGPLHDLPPSMVASSLMTQSPETLVLAFTGPGKDGRVDIVEATKRIPVMDEFDKAADLVERLDELAEAVRVKLRERRYTQAFRERHYDFLRKFVQLKAKIDRTIQS